MPLTQRQKDAARKRLAKSRRVPSHQISDSDITAAIADGVVTLTQITQDCASSTGGYTGSSDSGSSGGSGGDSGGSYG